MNRTGVMDHCKSLCVITVCQKKHSPHFEGEISLLVQYFDEGIHNCLKTVVSYRRGLNGSGSNVGM